MRRPLIDEDPEPDEEMAPRWARLWAAFLRSSLARPLRRAALELKSGTFFRHPSRRTAARWLPRFLVMTILTAGCATKTTSYEIRHRSLVYDASSRERDYKEELEYIRTRRQNLCALQTGAVASECRAQVRRDVPGDPVLQQEIRQLNQECDDAERERRALCARAGSDNQTAAYEFTGLAFSGGGIRSASFSLGVLQAMNELHLLSRVDYMSAVSGGGYMAGWVQAHLGGNQHDIYRDSLYYKTAAKDFDELLEPNGDNVEQLTTHAGFLSEGGYFEGSRLALAYIWRWPFDFVIDVAAHLKVGINRFHPITIYEKRIENTYFRGEEPAASSAPPKRALKLSEVNYEPTPGPTPYQGTTPYLIINGNLVNGGPPRDGSGACPEKRRQPATTVGYYVSRAVAPLLSYLGRPMTTADETCDHYNFEFTRDFTGSDGLGYIKSEAFDRHIESVDEANGKPVRVTVDGEEGDGGQFPLARAVAAAGAAFDPDGYFSVISNEWLRSALDYAASPLNLNLGYETWNFSRSYNGWFWTPIDYLRMLTVQRLWEPATDARWIKVTDGGHYENLGIASLVRRGASCIVAVDAGADPKWEFDDLKILVDRLKELGLVLKLNQAVFDEARARGHVKLTVTNENNTMVATILYLKPVANPVAMSNGDHHPDRVPRHMDDEWWRSEKRDADAVDKIRKIEWYQRTRAATDFPHTSTMIQKYDWETFEAYRLLGFQMAKTYLPYNRLDKCEFSEGE